MKRGLMLLMASLMVLSTTASGQGDKQSTPPEKVSSAMMQKVTTDTTQHDARHEADAQAAQDTVMARDFETIRAAVQSSTTFIVIKALALGVALIGIGVVYLPRRRMGNP